MPPHSSADTPARGGSPAAGPMRSPALRGRKETSTSVSHAPRPQSYSLQCGYRLRCCHALKLAVPTPLPLDRSLGGLCRNRMCSVTVK